MKHRKWGSVLCSLIWAVLALGEGTVIWAVWRLNMLPNGYFAGMSAGMALVWLLVGLLLRPGKEKKSGAYAKVKTTGRWRRVLGTVLALAITAGCVLACRALNQVQDTVDGITGADQTVSVPMSVYVLDDHPATKLEDLEGCVLGLLQGFEEERTNQALAQIREILGDTVTEKRYETLEQLIAGLSSGECDGVIFHGAYVTILEEMDQFQDFTQGIRVVYTAVVEEQVPVSEPEQTQQTQEETIQKEEPYSITTHPFLLYISGSDTRDYYLTTSRSDVNILMVVNPVTKQVLLVNTPRDYYISNPAGHGAKDKLTHCGIYGPACSIGALEDLYGVDIRYYAQINFTGVETLVDAIGGIDVYSDEGFYAFGQYWIDQGMNHLDGEHALMFARDRHHVTGGDNGRGRHQMAVIQAVIQKATSSGTTIVENYAQILASIQGMFKTDITSEEIGELVKMQLSDLAQWNVQSFAVTGTGGSDITYSMPGLYCYVMYPDESRVAYASELMERVMNGEILTDEDVNP